jgi:predicted esterase
MRRLTNKSTFDLVYCRLSLNPFPRGLLLGLSLIACSSASLNAQANRQPSQMSDEARKGYHEAVVGIVSRLAVDGTPEQYKTVADAYAVRRQYDEAAVYYLTAIKMKPGFARAEYDLACDLAMWGQNKVAVTYLARAADHGFWAYPAMAYDTDLANVKSDPAFAELLAKVEKNYRTEATKHPPGATVRIPSGSAPQDGWPVILFLHGRGSRRSDFDKTAEMASKLGFVGISVDGPVVFGENSYMWPISNAQDSSDYLQQVLAKQSELKINPKQVYLAGFSQGAQHAAILVATHPEKYAGAVVNSPGALAAMPAELSHSDQPRRLFLMVGDSDTGGKTMVAKFESLWKAANQPVQVLHYPGGHQFVPNAEDEYRKAIQWVVQGKQ